MRKLILVAIAVVSFFIVTNLEATATGRQRFVQRQRVQVVRQRVVVQRVQVQKVVQVQQVQHVQQVVVPQVYELQAIQVPVYSFVAPQRLQTVVVQQQQLQKSCQKFHR